MTAVISACIKKKFIWRLVQDGRVEGCVFTPSCESTGITTNCWTVIDRKTLKLTKKDNPHPKTKEKPQWDSRRGAITIKSNPITAGWVTHKWENNYTTEVHPPGLGVKILSPTLGFTTWGYSNGRRNSQKLRLWRLVGFNCRTSTRLGETEAPLLEGTHKVVCTSGPRRKEQWPHRRLNHSASVGGSPAEAGGSCASLWGQGHWQQKFWNVLHGMSLSRVCQ